MRTASEPLRGVGKQGQTWTATLLRDDQRPRIAFTDAPWGESLTAPVQVHGFVLGQYEVTRSDDANWRALLTINAEPAKMQMLKWEKGRKADTTPTPVHVRPFVERVEIMRTTASNDRPRHDTHALTDTNLPLSSLLRLCLRAGGIVATMHPAGSTFKGQSHHENWITFDEMRDTQKPSPELIDAVLRKARPRNDERTTDELHKAVLEAVNEWERLSDAGLLAEKRDVYVARAANRSRSNIRRDIANARAWEQQQKKARKKGGKK